MNQLAQFDRLQMPWKYKLAYLIYQLNKLPQAGCPVMHSFDGDKYIREMKIPADTLFIGRTHLNGHRVELVSGTVLAISDSSRQEISAPYSFNSVPGYQAVFYAVTDVVGRTVHPNPDGLRDVQVLEDRDFEKLSALMIRGAMIEQKLLEAA